MLTFSLLQSSNVSSFLSFYCGMFDQFIRMFDLLQNIRYFLGSYFYYPLNILWTFSCICHRKWPGNILQVSCQATKLFNIFWNLSVILDQVFAMCASISSPYCQCILANLSELIFSGQFSSCRRTLFEIAVQRDHKYLLCLTVRKISSNLHSPFIHNFCFKKKQKQISE